MPIDMGCCAMWLYQGVNGNIRMNALLILRRLLILVLGFLLALGFLVAVVVVLLNINILILHDFFFFNSTQYS